MCLKKRKLDLFLAIWLTIVTACSVDNVAKVDRMFKAYSGNKVPGAVVMIIKNGEPILKKAYGRASMEENIAMGTQTNLRLATVSKQFTTMCIMMLVEQGKLTYNYTLENIWPAFPDYGNIIKIRHLLQHTSGLIDYESLIPDTATVQVKDKDVLQMMNAQDSTYIAPGSDFRYSNSGYARQHHSGSTRGFRNVIQRYPEEKFTVIVLTNRSEPDVSELADQLTDLDLGNH